MARKAVNGYPEKSYYDNTVYAGINATGGPLNEGSFALITNFNITDGNRSLTPRDGYLTTTFVVDGEEIILSDKVLIYRDPAIQQNVIIDLGKAGTQDVFAYLVNINTYDVNTDDKKLFQGKAIAHYDVNDVVNFLNKQVGEALEFSSFVTRLTIVGENVLQPVNTLDNVIYYVTKLHYEDTSHSFNFWIKFVYRKDETRNLENLDEPLEGDTLIISVIDTTQQTKQIDSPNIASAQSIVPSPENMRTQEEVGVVDTETTDIGTTMLVSTPKGYVTEFVHEQYRNNLKDIELHPIFHLQDPSRILNVDSDNTETCKWAFRFDFINTSIDSKAQPRYKTPWRHLPVENTFEGECEIIEELDIVGAEIEDFPTYTYYVVPLNSSAYCYSRTVMEETEITSIAPEEFVKPNLYEQEFLTALKAGQISPLTVTNIHTISRGLRSIISSSDYLENLDLADDVYREGRLTFLTQDEIEDAMYIQEDDNENEELIRNKRLNATSRCLSFKTGALNDEWLQQYGVETHTDVQSPGIVLKESKYVDLPLREFNDFQKHAIEKGLTHNIKIVFLPFAMKRTHNQVQLEGDTYRPPNTVCLMSAGGIYMTSLINTPSIILSGSCTPWETVKNTQTNITLTTLNSPTSTYTTYFRDLNNLCLGDVLEAVPREVFRNGISVMLYLRPYQDKELQGVQGLTVKEKDLKNASWDASSFPPQVANIIWSTDRNVVYIKEVDDINPKAIEGATTTVIFEDRLVVWSGNRVYLSDEGNQYFFSKLNVHTFPEEVLKVIAFKTILLVFTTQNLYAVYRVEEEVETIQKDEEGKTLTAIRINWMKQCVLYNINPDRQYLDAIQVYNQMILFYSSEGQLYMIKPSATIDSETQFGIQYFNKSANHILENYDEYINQRLQAYGKLDVNKPETYVTKDQVKIKVLLDIDTIKIFYSVPNRITFVLVYDVVNNRYITYDTLSFTDVQSLWHAEGGEVYLTKTGKGKTGKNTYITVPVKSKLGMDQNADMHYQSMFKKEPIFTLIDTGNLNLNPHLTKRMRDLRVTLKNLDATKILYNAEVMLDDTITRPMYAPDFKVKMINGPSYTMSTTNTPQEDVDELFGMEQTLGKAGSRTDINSTELYHDKAFFEKNALLKTETINSSKLIEYNSSILSMGKNVRLKLQFISKGKYKLHSFGIIYKERHV